MVLPLMVAGTLDANPASIAGAGGEDVPQCRRPSILLILPDQMRGQALGCMGNPDVRTPNLDRLAAQEPISPGLTGPSSS
jgi:hypothetical protein